MFPPFNFNLQGRQVDPKTKFLEGFKNLFPAQEEENPYQFSSPSIESQPNDFMSVYRELMSQSRPAMDNYRKFVEQDAPRREDFSPSKTSRLGAILSGAAAGFQNPGSGQEIVQNMLDRPYEQGMRRYTDKGNRLQQLASLEDNEYKNKVSAVKSIQEMQNKDADNKRADDLAKSLISQRSLTMKETQQRIEANGATFHVDNKSGTGYLVKRDGTRIPVGQFDIPTGEKLINDISKMQEQDRLIGTRQVKLAGINNSFSRGQQEDRQRFDEAMEGTRQVNREKIESVRQVGREKLTSQRMEEARKRIELRLNSAKNPRTTQVLKDNMVEVQKLIDDDPSLEEFWDSDRSDPLGEAPSKDSPEFEGWLKLRNALYKGIGTTPSGNSIVRTPGR